MDANERIVQLEEDAARVRKLRSWLDERRAEIAAPWPTTPGASLAEEKMRRVAVVAMICAVENVLDDTTSDGLEYLQTIPPFPGKGGR